MHEPFVLSVAVGTLSGMDYSHLLLDARWQAGLTQSEVAARAGTSQQAIGRYEKGRQVPTLRQLERLLAACGVRLSVSLDPEPGLEDQPTRDLLRLPPLERLPEGLRAALAQIMPVLRQEGVPFLVAEKAAARLQGAVIRVWHLEFWVDDATTDPARLEAALTAAGGRDVFLWERDGVWPDPRPRLEQLWLSWERSDVRFRGISDLAVPHARALVLALDGEELRIAAPCDAVADWHPRDRDRLALQRATRLRREEAEPEQL